MIGVIGAGPAGSYFSSLMKENVMLFEEHKEIGKPVACTGIMTPAIFDLTSLRKDVIVNTLDTVRVLGPHTSTDIPLKEKEIVVDRARLDQSLAEQALENGVIVKTEHKFVGNKKGHLFFNHKNNVIKYPYEVLVGADGPYSTVARINTLSSKRAYWVAKQYSVKVKTEPNVFTVFFGDVPDFFGWMVPESDSMARIGIASKKHVAGHFDALLKKLDISQKNLVECQAGPIPIYDPRARTSKENIYLLGDAAGHVKATTGGGIVYGMRGARCLADSLKNGKDYEKTWRNEFGKELWFHLQIRKFLDKLSSKDYDQLISLLQTTDLGKYNRDYPLQKLHLLMKPGLFFFALRNLLKNNL